MSRAENKPLFDFVKWRIKDVKHLPAAKSVVRLC